MNWQRKALRVGSWVILAAVVLRLWSNGAPQQFLSWLRQPEMISALLFLETGKVFRPPPEEPVTTTPPTEPSAIPTEPPAALPVFSEADAALVYVRDTSGNTADLPDLLETPLHWDLTGATPTVLIYHTHATESYTQTATDRYEETSDYRTLDPEHNLVSIGDRLAQLLLDAGIGTIHSDTLHDYPSYDGGYDNSRKTIQGALANHNSIQLVLDLHRDAAVDSHGNQFSTAAQVGSRESAQILFLVGTDHPHWQQNMALAVKLTALLERMHPGITRGIITRTYDYNQDLSPGALLVEVGAAGDTREKALVAVEALAEAIIALSHGSKSG